MGVWGIAAGSAAVLTVLLALPVLGRIIHSERKLFGVNGVVVVTGVVIWIVLLIVAYLSPGMKHF